MEERDITRKVAQEAIYLINTGQKLAAVKLVNDFTHWGLKKSKDWCDEPKLPEGKSKKKLKYLQDMTHEDFDRIFNPGPNATKFADSYKDEEINSFYSLHGFMICISKIGNGQSYPVAKKLGYDVEYTLPFKQPMKTGG